MSLGSLVSLKRLVSLGRRESLRRLVCLGSLVCQSVKIWGIEVKSVSILFTSAGSVS